MKPRAVTTGLRILVGLFLVLGAVVGAGATTFDQPGFSEEVVASGLTDPTAFAFFPDGRIAIAQKGGVVRLVKNGALLPTPLIDISGRVNDYWDRGLLGIAVDPGFASNPYVYLLYTYENDANEYEGPKTARLGRFTVTGDTASPSSEVVVLGTVVGRSCNDLPYGSDCLPSDGASHSIGNVKFAPDQTLFVTVGDSASFNFVDYAALRSQNLTSLAGKVLRVTRTGQGVATNPFWTGNANDNRSKVWASGLRNAYRFNLRPGSDVPYVGDVGWSLWEDISAAVAGANLGWPCYEGSSRQSGYVSFGPCQALYAGSEDGIGWLGTPIARVPTPLGGGPNLGVIQDGDKPPVGNTDSSRQYDSWDGANSASEDWVGYSFASSHTFNRIVFQEGKHFWGRWVVHVADGASTARRAVGGSVEPGHHTAVCRQQRRELRDLHADLQPDPGRWDPDPRGPRGLRRLHLRGRAGRVRGGAHRGACIAPHHHRACSDVPGRRSEPGRDPRRGQTARREHRLEPSVRQLGRGQLRERGLGRL